MRTRLPALRFEAEAFQLGPDKILGRQSAGEAFLRAALAMPGLEEVIGCGPSQASAQPFGRIVKALAPQVTAKWVHTAAPDALARAGTVHFPDPTLGDAARTRLAVGAGAYSLSGVTHTIASLGAMRALADIATGPLMEWDGVICTSEAVKAAALAIIAEQEDYLAWRTESKARPPRVQLPVIPLGVHCADFEANEAERGEARRSLGLGDGEVAFLFVGRLSFHAKAHPYPMYLALEEAVRRTGKRIALVQCGWFANEAIEKTFREGAARHAPSVRHLFLDGRQAEARRHAWAAGDVFVSLSDNIQETFGLTPLEAMAAGMPVIVTDWNGYRQTVSHEVCGYMIPTFAPADPAGQSYALAHALETINYDHYLSYTARHISLDLARLFDAAEVLAADPIKRHEMGEAGRRIARERFDWSVVMHQYLEFWDELERIRTSARDERRLKPRVLPDRLDPFRLFAHHPTQRIDAATRLRVVEGRDFRELLADPLFDVGRETLPADDAFAALIEGIGPRRGRKLGEAAAAARVELKAGMLIATMLLKLGVLEVR